MDQKTYLTERIDDQIKWFSNKSKTNQNRYKLLKLIVIIASVTLPFLVGFINDENDILKIIVGVIGVVIAGIEGILALYKYKDLWLQYRLTSEMLQREKLFFITQSGHYHKNENAFKDFVNRAESIMSSENQSWLENLQQENESKD